MTLETVSNFTGVVSDEIATMEPLFILSQIVIAVGGVVAINLSQSLNWHTRRWASVVGVAVQPFWFIAAAMSANWGIFVLCFFYLAAWLRGFYNYWIRPPHLRIEGVVRIPNATQWFPLDNVAGIKPSQKRYRNRGYYATRVSEVKRGLFRRYKLRLDEGFGPDITVTKYWWEKNRRNFRPCGLVLFNPRRRELFSVKIGAVHILKPNTVDNLLRPTTKVLPDQDEGDD